jgi:hypothetical protein
MLMSVEPILADPMPGVPTSLVPMSASVNQDAEAMPEPDVLVHLPKWTAAGTSCVDPMLNADPKMELENASAHLSTPMAIRKLVVHLDQEVSKKYL